MQPEQDQNYWQSANPDGATPMDPPAAAVAPETPLTSPRAAVEPPITWQASEFIHHEKDSSWFLALLGVAIVLLLVDIFVVKSWTFGALIVVMAIAATVVGRRPPRIINYSLSLQGIQIDGKSFSFHDFRAFGVVQEGAFYSIRMIPSKRFMPMVSVYFPSDQGEKIVDVFGSALPMEHIELDTIDKLVDKIRF